MSNLRVDVVGFDELVKKIKLLASDKDKKREMLVLLRQIAKPTLSAAKTLVPVSKKPHKLRGETIQPGNLKKALGNITSKSKNPTILIGARAKGNNKGWYGNFVHDGHKIFNQRKSTLNRDASGRIVGASVSNTLTAKKAARRGISATGSTTANPYLTNAYEQTKGTVTADAEEKFAKFIQRRIDKLS